MNQENSRRADRVVWRGIISLVIICAGVSAFFLWRKASNQEPSTFSLAEYREKLRQFPSDRVLGPILGASDAKRKAETIWLEIYGEGVRSEKPYVARYDPENNAWLVHGSLPFYMLGGTAQILFDGLTGAVLAVWHEK